MANYSNLKAAIAAAIKTNGNQEITGQVLQDVLTSIVSVIGANYTFAGVATPSTNPGTPDQNLTYLAMERGTYTNFNGTVLPDGISLLMWNGTWMSETVMYGDGGVFDISVYKSSGGTLAKFADLAAALDGGNNIPTSARKGGMSVKFVQSSDNKYVQYRLMSNTWSTTINDWQGVDDVPTAGSENLVKSGGVANMGKTLGFTQIKCPVGGFTKKNVVLKNGIPYIFTISEEPSADVNLFLDSSFNNLFVGFHNGITNKMIVTPATNINALYSYSYANKDLEVTIEEATKQIIDNAKVVYKPQTDVNLSLCIYDNDNKIYGNFITTNASIVGLQIKTSNNGNIRALRVNTSTWNTELVCESYIPQGITNLIFNNPISLGENEYIGIQGKGMSGSGGQFFNATDHISGNIGTIAYNLITSDGVIPIEEEILKENDARIRNNKKWIAFGDSIIEGAIGGGNHYANGYVGIVAAIKGFDLINAGEGASGFVAVGERTGKNAIEIIRSYDISSYDLITIAWGINDYATTALSVGTIDDVAGSNSLYGKLKEVIEYIISQNARAKLIIITPQNASADGSLSTRYSLGYEKQGRTLQEMIDAEIITAKYYGLSFIDLGINSIVNIVNINNALTDGTHPSIDSYNQLGRIVASLLQY